MSSRAGLRPAVRRAAGRQQATQAREGEDRHPRPRLRAGERRVVERGLLDDHSSPADRSAGGHTIFGDPTKYAGLFHRAPDGSLSTDGTQCPGANCGYITTTNLNLGKISTNGLDLNASYRPRPTPFGNFAFNLNSTYVHKYVYQNEEGGEYLQNVNVYSGIGPIFRWQHSLSTTWRLGSWGAGLAGRFKSGYLDASPPNRVPSYTVFDVYGSWQPTKSTQLILGVRNVFDRQPPFTNQVSTFAVGYDPRFADVIGRAYYVRGSYNF